MPPDDDSNLDFPRTASPGNRARPNPAEDISEHGRPQPPQIFSPDGSGEAADADSTSQPARDAD